MSIIALCHLCVLEHNTVSQHVIVLLWHLIQFPNVYVVSSTYACTTLSFPSIIQRWVHPLFRTVIAGLNSISLEWSPPSEGSPLSYTLTWTGRGVVLPPTARNYTTGGLDSNTAYSGAVEVYSLAINATVFWNAHTLSQGKLKLQSGVLVQTIRFI